MDEFFSRADPCALKCSRLVTDYNYYRTTMSPAVDEINETKGNEVPCSAQLFYMSNLARCCVTLPGQFSYLICANTTPKLVMACSGMFVLWDGTNLLQALTLLITNFSGKITVQGNI